MYLACFVKNTSGAIKEFYNKELAVEEVYQIPDEQRLGWMTDDELLADIASGDLDVGVDASTWFDSLSDKLNRIKNIIDQPTDTDDAPLVRLKQATSGWTYAAHGLEFESSVLDSDYNKRYDGTDYNDTAVRLYNAAGEQITQQSVADTDCIKTVFEYEPHYDIEMIGGRLKLLAAPIQDVRVWFVAAPDIPAASGGQKVMVDGVNVRFCISCKGAFDGRVAKRMPYDSVNHTNKFHIIAKHGAGLKLKFMILMEYYRA